MKITYILAKNSTKIAAIRAALFDTNMHQIVCRSGLLPDPTGGAYSADPTGGAYSAPQTPRCT